MAQMSWISASSEGQYKVHPANSLIQHAVLEIRLVVEEEAGIAVSCRLDVAFAKGKVAQNTVFAIFERIRIEPRFFRGPGFLRAFRNGNSRFLSREQSSRSNLFVQ